MTDENSSPSETTEDASTQNLEADIVKMIQTIYDPEVPVDIYEMGLIYEINVKTGGDVYVKMTLTSPMCPVAESLPPEVQAKVAQVPGVTHSDVDLTWEPPWEPSMMSEAAKLDLGF